MTVQKENQELHAIIFAGPNGSGKTTLINAIKDIGITAFGDTYPFPEYFINPDQIAKDLSGKFANETERNSAAFHKSIALRNEAIGSMKPFAYETVMSHPTRINEMLKLKERGYTVLVTFITTDSPDKNVARVKHRFASKTTTGHDVPEQTIRDRYERTLALLPKATEIADATFVYDNSADNSSPTLQAFRDRTGSFELSSPLKPWVQQRLVEPLQQRQREIGTLIKALDTNHQPHAFPDELRGNYSGVVIASTKHFVLQFDEERKQSIIHDRLMLETAPESSIEKDIANYATNSKLAVQYSEKHAPVIAQNRAIEIAKSTQQKTTPER